MAFELKTNIIINTPSEKVWEVLTNFENYNTWNPFIKSITGEPKTGNIINVEFEKMNFKPKVLVFEKNKKFEWVGKLLFKGLFDGKHQFLLSENKNGTTNFKHSEKFTGILVPLLKKRLKTEFYSKFEEMNFALKKQCEK
jgi:hypothetical protein